jgi:hypothetical protein
VTRGLSRKAELAPTARALRAEGWLGREIAAHLDVGVSTVFTWLDDPDLAKQAARRAAYARPCVDCGTPTNGSGGHKDPATRCAPCARRWAQEQFTIWTRDRIIERIQTWAATYGRPPAVADWSSAHARKSPTLRRPPLTPGDWPSLQIVQRRFGSWSAAIVAAGHTPLRGGRRRRAEFEAAKAAGPGPASSSGGRPGPTCPQPHPPSA